jgi:PEP-CTERM motif
LFLSAPDLIASGELKEKRMRSRKPVRLGERFNKRWLGYAAAAGILGVSTANASDVYFPVNEPIGYLTSVDIAGFTLDIRTTWWIPYHSVGSKFSQGYVGASFKTPGAGIERQPSFGKFGAIVSRGAQIGPSQQFQTEKPLGIWGQYTNSGPCFLGCGPGYLGVEIPINGQAHYGWVSLEIPSPPCYGGPEGTGCPYGGEIFSYGYDTVPGQPIPAGASPEPGTLGLLALGSLGLAFWRRKANASQQ